jgi:hypothetical protein
MTDPNLTNALNSINTAGGAAQQLAEALLAASRTSTRQATAADIAGREMERFGDSSQRTRNAMLSMYGVLVNVSSNIVNLGTAAYTADKAFTGMLPVLDAVTSVLKGTFDTLGKMGSGITIAGFSLGRSSEAAAQAAGIYVDSIQAVLKFQLEAAQAMSERFVELNKNGALFGGGLTEIRNILFGYVDSTGKTIKGIGLPFQEFTKIITENVGALATLGSDIKSNGLALASVTRQLFFNNSALAAMYGSVTELAKGTAAYMSLQAQLGENAIASDDLNDKQSREHYLRLERSAGEYLMRQKELSAITGKTAERLKQEEQARRMQLDYTLKLSRLGTDARNNVEESMQIAGKMFGDAGARYAQEYFATQGKVVSKENLIFQATAGEAADVIAAMLNGVNQSRVAFRQNTTTVFQDAGEALKNYALSNEQFAEINRAANNSILKGMTDVSSAVLQALPMIENMGKMFAQIEADRKNITTSLDVPLAAFVAANKEMLANRIELDKTVIKAMSATVEKDGQIVSAMGELVSALYKLQRAIMDVMPDAMAAFQKLQSMQNDPKQVLEDFAAQLARAMGFGNPNSSTAPNTPALPNNQPPARSEPSGPSSAIRPSQIPGLNPSDIAPTPSRMSRETPAPPPAPPAPAPAPPPAQNTSSISQDLVVALLKETADQNDKLGQLIAINQRTLNAVS